VGPGDESVVITEPARKEGFTMYIGGGTVVLILIIVLIVFLVRR
jgi:Tfp pilus assembly protein PilN